MLCVETREYVVCRDERVCCVQRQESCAVCFLHSIILHNCVNRVLVCHEHMMLMCYGVCRVWSEHNCAVYCCTIKCLSVTNT